MPRALLGQTLSTLFNIAAWRGVDADDDYTDTDDNGADDDKDDSCKTRARLFKQG